MNNIVKPVACKILDVKKESLHEWTFKVATDIKPSHGQFLQLSIPKIGEAPISVSGYGDGWMDFTIRSDEKASGAAMWDFIGYVEEVRDAAAEWVSWLDGQGAATVVCLDPQDVFFYREQAAKWDIKAKCSIVTPIEFVADLVGKGRISIRKNALKAVYHDPTVYARNLMDTETPRNLLKEAGVDAKELFLHGHLARSSGSRILRRIDPDLQAKVAEGLWDDIIALGSDAVVTSSPSALCNLEESAPDGMKVLDIFEVL